MTYGMVKLSLLGGSVRRHAGPALRIAGYSLGWVNGVLRLAQE